MWVKIYFFSVRLRSRINSVVVSQNSLRCGLIFVNVIRYKRLIFTFIILLSVSCSSTKIFYNHADLLLINWFESYLELSEKQRSELNIKVENFFTWHRKSELPKIVLFLEGLKVRYENGIDKQDINWVRAESKILWKRILNYAEDDIVFLPFNY